MIGFLAGMAIAGVGLLVTALALFIGYRRIARISAAVVALAVCVYGVLLLGYSLASHSTILARGQEKYFCEIDCHLAYSVPTVEVTPVRGFVQYAITIQTRFDETSVAASRPKDAPLAPNPREIFLIDDHGRQYAVTDVSGTDLREQLRPGERYRTLLRFEVPADAHGLRLLVRTPPSWPDHFVIGDENSFAHAKTFFAI